jgi:tetratricopeptide (TPR) repeat protein
MRKRLPDFVRRIDGLCVCSSVIALVAVGVAIFSNRNNTERFSTQSESEIVLKKLEELNAALYGTNEKLLSYYTEQNQKTEHSLDALSKRLGDVEKRLSKFCVRAGDLLAEASEESAQAHVDPQNDREIANLLRKAEDAYSAHKYKEAAELYSSLCRFMPGESGFLAKRALALYRANPAETQSYSVIERDLKLAQINRPGDPEVCETLANIAMERGDFASAQAYFAQLAELHPADVDLLVDACECALLAGDRAGALRYFERASARAPEDPALQALRPRVEAAREAEEGTR